MKRTLANEFKGMGISQSQILEFVNNRLKDTSYTAIKQTDLSKILNGKTSAPKSAFINLLCLEYLRGLKNEN